MTLVERSQIQADRMTVITQLENPKDFDPLYSISLKKSVAPILSDEEKTLLDRQIAGEDIYAGMNWLVVE